jgi:quinol monooxygenase YgiN
MINEYIRYRIPAGRLQAFLDAYAAAGASLRTSKHCLGYELSHCSEDREAFILQIKWDSADGHLKGFRGSPEFAPFLQAVQPFMKSIEEMRHYELTALTWNRQPSETT